MPRTTTWRLSRSKRRSGTKPSQPPPDPVFFTDRDLGKIFPQILKDQGLLVEPYSEHIADPRAPDDEWLKIVAERGWIALSHDDNIRRDPEAVRAVMENGGRLFILRGACSHSDLAALFLQAQKSVRNILRKNPGAFIAAIRRSAARGSSFRAEVHVWLTYEQWIRDKGQ